MRQNTIGALALAACLSSGCASYETRSAVSQWSGHSYYSGVMADVQDGCWRLRDAFAADDQRKAEADPRLTSLAFGAYSLLVDLPLSAIADTLIAVPWVIYEQFGNAPTTPRILVPYASEQN